MLPVQKLVTDAFGGHVHREIRFTKPAAIIMGPNASGKSTVKDAIEWDLTGSCSGTDARGAGFEGLIYAGADQAAVSLWLAVNGDKELIVNRTATHRGTELQVEGWQGTSTIQQASLLNKLGQNGPVTKDQVHVLLNSSHFYGLPLSDQKRILLDSLGLAFGLKDLVEMATIAESDQAAFVMAIRGIEESIQGVELLQAVEKAVRDARRDAKRDLKKLQAQIGEKPKSKLPDDVTTADGDTCRRLLKQLRAQREDIIQRQARAEELLTERPRIENELADLGKEYERLEAEIAKKQDMLQPSPEIDDAVVADLTGELAEIERGCSEAEKRLVEVKAELLQLTTASRRFRESPGICVVLPALKCPVTTEDSVALAGMVATIKRLDAEAIALEANIANGREKECDLRDKRAKAENPVQPDGPTEGEIKAAEEYRDSIGDRIESQSMRLTEIIRGPKVKTEGLDEELAELEKRITHGESLIEEIIRTEEAENRLGEKQAEIEAAETQTASLERLVTAFGPKGVIVGLLEKYLEGFRASMAEAVRLLSDGQYDVKLLVEPDLHIEVLKDGIRTPRLSTSEELRMGIVLQVALAKQIGLPLVVVDNADWLDTEARALFADLMDQMVTEGLQVIVLATGKVPEGADTDWIQYVDLAAQGADCVIEIAQTQPNIPGVEG